MRFRSIRYPSAAARGGLGPLLNTASPYEADCAEVRRPSLEDAAAIMRGRIMRTRGERGAK